MIRRAICWSVFGLALVSGRVAAQASSLPPRLSAETRATLERLIDSVRAAGLPSTPLADKAAEGVLKGADDQRIVMAVRTLVRELGEARGILGGSGDATLLTATASALHAGASAPDLRRLVRPSGDAPDPHTLATALVTLVDLVAKRIPAAAATTAVGELLKRRATDDQFVVLRSEVEQDIRGGTAPEAALTKRIRSHVDLLDALPMSGRAIKPPAPPV